MPDSAETIRASKHFDPDWYLAQYPDVALSGMEPAEHFAEYGALLRRHPGPDFDTGFYLDTHREAAKNRRNPLTHLDFKTRKHGAPPPPDRRAILWAAARAGGASRPDLAAALAERHLPEDLAYTANILRANAAIKAGREDLWLAHVNAYLAEFDVAPIDLAPGPGPLLARFTTAPLPEVADGPLVTVIMPAFNAEKTVAPAVRSILAQTWQRLELIVVDDASTDSTWQKLQELDATDSRMRILRNKINVGPYVSKNIAVTHAAGDYITGHDADDWAHPQRLENHLAMLRAKDTPITASFTYMLRLTQEGTFSDIKNIGGDRLDGVFVRAAISCMFERSFFDTYLGFWDCVRFGADSEMITRAETLFPHHFSKLRTLSMLCIDHADSLTNHPEYGISKHTGMLPVRREYRNAWQSWHREALTAETSHLPFPQAERHFPAPDDAQISADDILKNIT